MIVLSKAEKNRVRSKSHVLSMFWRTLCAAPSVFRRYRQLMAQSFNQPVALDGRIGVALHPHAEYVPVELKLLEELGNPPVLLRFCHQDRKSTRLNSSHVAISYAVFCLKKKTTHHTN